MVGVSLFPKLSTNILAPHIGSIFKFGQLIVIHLKSNLLSQFLYLLAHVSILRRIAAKIFYLFLLAAQSGDQLHFSSVIQVRFTFGLINDIFYKNPQKFNVKFLLVQLFMLYMIIYSYFPDIIYIMININLVLKMTVQYSAFALMQVLTDIWNICNQFLRVKPTSFQYSNKYCIGGGKSKMFSHSELFSAPETTSINISSQFEFVAYVTSVTPSPLALSNNNVEKSCCLELWYLW